MRLGASAYLAHGPLNGPTFEAAAAADATLAFNSLHIPEDSPSSGGLSGHRCDRHRQRSDQHECGYPPVEPR
ncbi:hypothetical protein EDF23_11231 [Curtobacterium sp. PhB128]|nr:hypothetical protein EDF23_11231 [Curtobacterium sp. PhB128]TCL90886.1 hypothetical protein EDF29_11231 [Curtobacterium sp. PhB138]